MRYPTIFLTVLLAAHLLAPHPAQAWTAKSKSIHDGDSFTTTLPDETTGHIRLYGIDAPEAKQAFGLQARKRLVGLIARRNLELEAVDKDRYGRTVAVVHTSEGLMANEEMVRSGLAWVYDQYCKREDICEPLRSAEAEARTARRGLWADENPTPPWEWRKEHKREEWYTKPVRALKTITNKIKYVFRP